MKFDQELLQRIMSGTTPVLICANRGQCTVPIKTVDAECAICAQLLSMDAGNINKKAEIGAVTVCGGCGLVLLEFPGSSQRAMIGGKIMGTRDGLIETSLLRHRN